MIEPSAEMVQAFTRHFFTCFRDSDVRDALAAVLAIVERDYPRIETEQCGQHADHDRHVWLNPGAYADRVCGGKP